METVANTASPTASRWSDLTRRVLSAALLLPVAVFCIWAGGWWFLALVAVACAGLAAEWVSLCRYWPRSTRPAVASRDLILGVPYIGLAAVALPWLRADPIVGWPNTLFMLSVIWGSDIGAYVIGRLVAGPKLAPAISPGKTWSGAAGGLCAAALAGLGAASGVSSGFSPSRVLSVAVALGLIAQAGDLMESALKRHFGVKDSGRAIPGHGGLLDRLDAVLAVAPATALLAYYVGRGVVLWR